MGTVIDREKVAVLETGAASPLLERLLDALSVDVVRPRNVRELAASGSVSGLVAAEPGSLVQLASEIQATDVPPLLLAVSRPEAGHPLLEVFTAALTGKQEWQATFDAIVDPVAILDAEGRIVRANVGFSDLAGCPVRAIAGRAGGDLLGAVEGGNDPVAATLADGEPRIAEARFARVPGTYQVTTSPLREGGAVRGLVLILKDLTRTREEQERMRQAARLADIGRLAGGVAHEINTPLASIALRTERLLRAARDPRLQEIESFKDFPRYLTAIENEVFRCKKIITSLLDFSRSRPPELRRADLNQLARRAVDLVSHQFQIKQIDLTLELAEGLPPLTADHEQLRQALVALLMNAYDATPSGGRVRVTTAAEGEGRVRVAVADTGEGIAPEDYGRIFSPFFTTRPPGQGTGLGLAVCHGIVTAHGGEIWVDTEPGAGTRVSLILPVSELAPEDATRAGR